MGILNTFSPKNPEQGVFFSISTSFLTAQDNYQIIAGVSGKSLYLTDVVLVAGGSAGSITLTEAPTGTVVNVIDPIQGAANAVQSVNLKIPVVVSAGASLRISTDLPMSTSRTVIIAGYRL